MKQAYLVGRLTVFAISMTAQAVLAAGTLSGQVVDAVNPATPVYPVDIDLMDPATGDQLGLFVRNQPDGSYTLADIPPGDYKIFFNAWGAANAYGDELYDGVSCDNGGCDRAVLGDTITIAEGANTLDVQLSRAISVSGRITDESGEPLSGVVVEILDRNADIVSNATESDQNGDWVAGIGAAGTHYARVPGIGAPGFQPELWNDHPCVDCYTNPLAFADPFEVSAEGAASIDFTLSPANADTTLSGQIHDWTGQPLESAVVRLIDEGGQEIGTSLPDATGNWSISVLANTRYFLQVEDASGVYSPQLWSATNCEACDVLQLGTPVDVLDESIQGLDFYLVPRSLGIIFQSSMESVEDELEINPPCCAPFAYTPGSLVSLAPVVSYSGSAPLVYSLESGPSGMVIDSASGLITWQTSDADTGSDHDVAIRVDNGIASSETFFVISVLQGEAQTTVVSENSTEVTTGPLTGLSFSLPAVALSASGIQALTATAADVSVYRLDSGATVPLPPRVIRLTDFFYTNPIESDEPLRVTFPDIQLPEGRELSELQLFSFSKPSLHADAPVWIPSSISLSVVNDRVAVDVHRTGTLMFVGLYPASAGPEPGLSNVAAKTLLNQAAITCEANTWYSQLSSPSESRPGFTACTFSDPESPMLVQIQSLDSDHFWTSEVTPEMLAATIVAARSTAVSNGFSVANRQLIKIGAFAAEGLTAFVHSDDGFAGIYINSWVNGSPTTYPRWFMEFVVAHEYFHVLQAFNSQNSFSEINDFWEDGRNEWLLESVADWFTDEVFDAGDYPQRYRGTVPPILRHGAARVAPAYDLDFNYRMWPLFKLIAQRCAALDFKALYTISQETPISLRYPSRAVEKFVQSLATWDCNFGERLPRTNNDSVAELFLDFQLSAFLPEATDPFDPPFQRPEADFGEASGISFKLPDEFEYDVADSLPALQIDQVEDLPVLSFDETRRTMLRLPRNSAGSFVVKGYPGNQLDGRELNLVLSQGDPTGLTRGVKVHISSLSEPAEFSPFSLIVMEGQDRSIPYVFAGRSMPDLFVTVVNEPSLGPGNDTSLRNVSVGLETVTEKRLTLNHFLFPTGRGRVVSNPPGIDCDSDCAEQSAMFEVNSTVTLTAIPDPGADSKFTGWLDVPECEGSRELTCEIRMDDNRNVYAKFDRDYAFVFGARSNDGTQFYALTQPLRDGDTITLRNGIIYRTQLILDGEVVNADNGGLTSISPQCGPLQADDVDVGPLSFQITDKINSRNGWMELNFICSNDGYRRAVDSVLTQQNSAVNCADNELVYSSDGFIYNNGVNTGVPWSAVGGGGPMKNNQCDTFSVDGCGGAEALMVAATSAPFCFQSQYMGFFSDGTARLGQVWFTF